MSFDDKTPLMTTKGDYQKFRAEARSGEGSANLPPDKVWERIQHYVEHPCQNSRVFEITPEVAMQVLDKFSPPGSNRKKKPIAIKRFSKDMASGEWDLTGDTLKFSDAKLLSDGQNRLIACVKADVPFKTHVVFGIPQKAFWRMDRGKVRNVGDGLYIGGYRDHPTQLGQAARWVKMIEENSVSQRPSFEPHELKTVVEAHPELEKTYVPMGMQIDRKWGHPAGLMAALCYVWNEKHPEIYQPLLAVLLAGQKIPERFKALDKAFGHINKQASMLSGRGRVNDVWRAGVLVKAWNLIVDNRKGKGQGIRSSDFLFDVTKDPFPIIS